jgi:hypothetical protein
MSSTENHGTLLSEDKIMFGLNALAVSQLTLAKIRKLYSKSDAKSIAKQVKCFIRQFLICYCEMPNNF